MFGFEKIYLTFFVTLGASFFWQKVGTNDRTLSKSLNAFSNYLRKRGAFDSNVKIEIPKFALIRVLFGLFMLERAFWIIFYMFPTDWADSLLVIFATVGFLGAFFIVIGFFTQATLAYFIIIHWQVGDLVLSTSTLGNDIATLLALLLIFSNSGAHFSVDGLLMTRKTWLRVPIKYFYYDFVIPTNNTLQIAKFVSLLGFWSVCLYSLSIHLGEPAWITGVAGPQLLSNNFMSSYDEAFKYVFGIGEVPIFAARISLWLMLPWFAFMVPCVLLGRGWRKYVIVWGLLFFFLSRIVLQLGWLAEFECLLWAALFWEKSFLDRDKPVELAFDDSCNLCDRTIAFVTRLDVFQCVRLRPLSKSKVWLKQMGIEPRDALSNLWGVETARNIRWHSGYDLYIVLTRYVLVLAPLYPILVLGKWTGVGPRIYRFIAERRRNPLGVCNIPSPKPMRNWVPLAEQVQNEISRDDPIGPVSLHFMLLAAVYLISVPMPFIGFNGIQFPEPLEKVRPYLLGSAHLYGVAPINVFNATDLKMAENWFTLHAVRESGEKIQLPVFTDRGQRLQMHRSDRVYFGHTLRFRRATINSRGCMFDFYSGMFQKFSDYFSLYYRESFSSFEYRQFSQAIANSDLLLVGRYFQPPPAIICTVRFGEAE